MGNRHHKLYLSQHTHDHIITSFMVEVLYVCAQNLYQRQKSFVSILESSQLTETISKTFSLRIQHKLFNFPLNRICVHHDKILGHVRFNILFIVEITFLLSYLYQVKNFV